MSKHHNYTQTITWTGNTGTGTTTYAGYERSHTLTIQGKPDIRCSADTPFRGDGSKHNPEDFFLASAASCHMLWYFHLCADAGVVVIDYVDNPTGTLCTGDGDHPGHFKDITLNPVVTVADESMIEKAVALHHNANKKCFIANSCNFTIHHKPVCKVAETV